MTPDEADSVSYMRLWTIFMCVWGVGAPVLGHLFLSPQATTGSFRQPSPCTYLDILHIGLAQTVIGPHCVQCWRHHAATPLLPNPQTVSV